MDTTNTPARHATTVPEIGLAAATHLELGLEALHNGDTVRAVGALASISNASWDAVLARFPQLPALLAGSAVTR